MSTNQSLSGPPSNDIETNSVNQRKYLYLVGIGVTHSVAPPLHNYIIQSLGYNWQFVAKECPTVDDAVEVFRAPSFAGGIVTMPYKKSIIPYLDGLDELAVTLGACNAVYRAADGTLRGTNTDWRGIKGCLLNSSDRGRGRPALIVGAGGASRAAIYALNAELGCRTIYVINRDRHEVLDLLSDTETYSDALHLVHVQSATEARNLPSPYYVVGSVPDFEPVTSAELDAREILVTFLSSAEEKGVLLDMCYKPRRTRTLKMGVKFGWTDVEGWNVVGHQFEEQYRLWCGEEECMRIDGEGAWRIMGKVAEESPAINS